MKALLTKFKEIDFNYYDGITAIDFSVFREDEYIVSVSAIPSHYFC